MPYPRTFRYRHGADDWVSLGRWDGQCRGRFTTASCTRLRCIRGEELGARRNLRPFAQVCTTTSESAMRLRCMSAISMPSVLQDAWVDEVLHARIIFFHLLFYVASRNSL